MVELEVVRPSNGHVLDGFLVACFYRLDNGVEFPFFDVACGWCLQCEKFVPVEVLYTIAEIENRIRELVDSRERWPAIDAGTTAELRKLNKDTEPPAHYFREHWHHTWTAALEWRQNRRSPPKCLVCGSVFGISPLPLFQVVPHPEGDGFIEVRCSGILGGLPIEHTFYDGEGRPLQSLGN